MVRTTVQLKKEFEHAINQLVYEPKNREWGGEVDFDRRGKTTLQTGFSARLGHLGTVTTDADYEVTWHTHPPEAVPIPSAIDIGNFAMSQAQVDIIAGKAQIAIIEKLPCFEENWLAARYKYWQPNSNPLVALEKLQDYAEFEKTRDPMQRNTDNEKLVASAVLNTLCMKIKWFRVFASRESRSFEIEPKG